MLRAFQIYYPYTRYNCVYTHLYNSSLKTVTKHVKQCNSNKLCLNYAVFLFFVILLLEDCFMYDAIFLTTPSRLFADVEEAHRCARALYDYILRFCKKNNIYNTSVEIGVSNVNPRKAQYVYQANGVGRPQKVLVGNAKKCFVRPHLHMIIEGKHMARISDIIIKYFIKRYKSLKNKKHGVKIWKKYIFNGVKRVKRYVWIQSLHYLTVSVNKRDGKIATKRGIKKRIINVRVKKHINTKQTSAQQNNYNQNYVLLCNLRNQWLVLEQLKKISEYIVNFDLYNTLVSLQNKIKMYGDMINANIDVASLHSADIANITIEIEKLRQITVAEKQKFDYFCS